MPDQPRTSFLDSLRRNPHRIAVALFALMLIGFVINAVALDDEATTFPTAAEADGDVPSPRAEPNTGNGAGLVAGFGLFGLWAVLGIVAFTRPSRAKRNNRARDNRGNGDDPAKHDDRAKQDDTVEHPTGDPSLN